LAYVDHLVEFEREELLRRSRFLRDEMPVLALTGQLVIVVDDGRTPALVAATAVEAVRRAGASHVVFAAPRCTPAMARLVRPLVDELVLLTGSTDRRTTVLCDEHFHQTTGEDVRRLIERTRSRWKGGHTAGPLATRAVTSTG
jgi:predicted phosphoribosyltransferase